jgi:hypothetical protein
VLSCRTFRQSPYPSFRAQEIEERKRKKKETCREQEKFGLVVHFHANHLFEVVGWYATAKVSSILWGSLVLDPKKK